MDSARTRSRASRRFWRAARQRARALWATGGTLAGGGVAALAFTAGSGLLIGGLTLFIGAYLLKSAAGNNVTAQMVGDTPGNVTDATAHSSWVEQAMGQFEEFAASLTASSAGSQIGEAVATDVEADLTTSGNSDSVPGGSLGQTGPNVNQSIDDKFAELAKNLGLDPNFGPTPGGNGGTGAGNGGSSGSTGGSCGSGSGSSPSVVGVYTGTYNDVADQWDSAGNDQTVYPSGPLVLAISADTYAPGDSAGSLAGSLTISNYEGMTISGHFTGSDTTLYESTDNITIEMTSGNVDVAIIGTYRSGSITIDSFDVGIDNQDGMGDEGGSIGGNQPFTVSQ